MDAISDSAFTMSFLATHEWKHDAFEISEFDGMDDHDLTGLTFAAGPLARKFVFQMDEVQFE